MAPTDRKLECLDWWDIYIFQLREFKCIIVNNNSEYHQITNSRILQAETTSAEVSQVVNNTVKTKGG